MGSAHCGSYINEYRHANQLKASFFLIARCCMKRERLETFLGIRVLIFFLTYLLT